MNTRLLTIATLASCFSFACQASTSYGYLEVKRGASVENKSLCPGRTISANTISEGIRLSANGRSILVETEDDGSTELIIGDFWSNGRCFVAVRTAQSDVNESYDLYEIRLSMTPRKLQGVTIVNPDFKGKIVTTSYRDAARWNYESVCYATRLEVPFVCAKRQFVTEDIEKMETCLEPGKCRPSKLVFSGTNRNVTANISPKRASIFGRLSGNRLHKTRAYLIKNDVITLLDYQNIGPLTYYQFMYKGARKNTIGWISSTDITIVAPAAAP